MLRIFLYFGFPHGDFASYVLMPCRADALCLGVLSAIAVRTAECWKGLTANRNALHLAAAILLVGIVFMTWKGYGPYSATMTTIGYSWLGLFYTCCLLLAVSGTSTMFGRVLRTPVLIKLGSVGYCSYLVHKPAIEACRRLFALRFASTAPVQLAAGVFGVGLTLLVAAASWKFFEKPLLRRGHRYEY